MFNPDYLGAWSVPEAGLMVAKITALSKKEVVGTGGKKDECFVADLEGEKPFILNATNAKMIAKLAESPFIEDWVGLEIVIGVEQVRFAGDTVEALRVKPMRPEQARQAIAKFKPAMPELTPSSEAWEKVQKAVKGGYTIAQVRTKYIISDENAKLLCA